MKSSNLKKYLCFNVLFCFYPVSGKLGILGGR